VSIIDNVTLDSREVAKMVEKDHKHLIRDIENYTRHMADDQNSKMISDDQSPDLVSDDFFIESSYIAGTGKAYKCYQVTRKGCEFIANKLTGEKGTRFTATYVNKFHEMEQALQEPAISTAPPQPQLPDLALQFQALESCLTIMKAHHEKLAEHDVEIQELKDKVDNLKPREILVEVEQIINKDIGDLTTHIRKEDQISTDRIARMYGFSAVSFNRLLHKMGIIEKHDKAGWQLTADNLARGFGIQSQPSPKCGAFIMWTPIGKKFLQAALKEVGMTPIKRLPAPKKRNVKAS